MIYIASMMYVFYCINVLIMSRTYVHSEKQKLILDVIR